MNKRTTATLLTTLLTAAHANAAEQASHLDTIQQKGELSVRTTGDYKPYTFLKSDGQ